MQTTDRTIAALFVEPDGPYAGLDGVEVWDEARDARKYAGPHPVVAHPPCNQWSLMANIRRQRDGQDDGCFSSALNSLRCYGGVLEHPAHSLAWKVFGLATPPKSGGWVNADCFDGWTCSVQQGQYGHPCGKPTWLYAVGFKLPALKMGTKNRPGVKYMKGLPGNRSGLRSMTPEPFRDLLLSMARSVRH